MLVLHFPCFTDEVSERSGSPFIDVEKVSSDDEDQLELMKRRLVACKYMHVQANVKMIF